MPFRFLSLFLTFLVAGCANPALTGPFTTAPGEPSAVAVPSVLRVDQLDAAGCIPASVATMLSSITGIRTAPEATGMSLEQAVSTLQAGLPGREVKYVKGEDDSTTLAALHTSLSRGYPVLIFLASENAYTPATWDFHASVLTSMDTTTQQVVVANVYGYDWQGSYQELVDRMSYRVGTWPFVQGTVLALGLQPKNAYILVN